uniref:Proliferating cell nuclear antigen n=1 Tax=Acrobeloides nanus TaxID=290746 RepID=A0A914EMB9_9BILA
MADDRDHMMYIAKENAKEIHQVLKSMKFKEYCTFKACRDGIQFVVDDHNFQQANAYLKTEIFSELDVRVDEVRLRVPMNILAECFNVFSGASTALRLTYDGPGEPLVVSLEDEGIVFKCSIMCQNPQHHHKMYDFEWKNENVLAKVILKPNKAKEIVRDLDKTSPTVRITVTDGHISFLTDGELGKIKSMIPAHSDQVEHMEACRERVTFSYRYNLIHRMETAFLASSKISLRIDNRGVMSTQFLIPRTDSKNIFIEFFTIAEVEWDDG